MADLLAPALAQGYAVPGFCTWNAETVRIILRTAADLSAPVVIMSGPGEFPLLPPAAMAAAATAAAREFDVPAALHLDHGESLEQVRECLEAGYTSVMLDYSTRPFEENAAALRQAVDMARPLGASVEGEVGAVGRVDDAAVEGSRGSTLTEPGDAARYVDATGVDALAVSIGNAHGIYTALPRFDFERLERIRAAAGVPLVLHGGSGTPEPDLRRAISLGVAKVNVATEVCRAMRDSLEGQWAARRNPWLPGALAEATGAIAAVAEKWFRLTGAAGRARA